MPTVDECVCCHEVDNVVRKIEESERHIDVLQSMRDLNQYA